ncbi:MAG: cysteine hydrolase [Deltaproteobacteria bacterium]|nr:cysteine hydrolase [Deltaproteobacteria bacterium]
MKKREQYATEATAETKCSDWLKLLDGSPGRRPLPSLSNAILVVIDLQRLFLDPSSPAFLPAWPGIEPRVRALLDLFRAARRPVVWTRHVDPHGESGKVIAHFGGKPMPADDALTAFVQGWQPGPRDGIALKSRYSAWTAPELRARMRPDSVPVFAGVTTHRCILATAVEAASRDRICVVAADACATSSERLHIAALHVLSNGLCHVASVSEIAAALSRDSGVGIRHSTFGIRTSGGRQ